MDSRSECPAPLASVLRGEGGKDRGFAAFQKLDFVSQVSDLKRPVSLGLSRNMTRRGRLVA